MPQVWLSYEELSEFLGCTEAEARFRAVSADWVRRVCIDDVMRVRLPPREALSYVVRNAKASFTPRDAVLLEEALAENARLKDELAAARQVIAQLAAGETGHVEMTTDLMVAALRGLVREAGGDGGAHGMACERSVA